jgi:hypothetical protein
MYFLCLMSIVNKHLKYKLNSIQIPEKLTKKNMLSVISTIFDPLGLVSPVTVKAKVILQ